MSASSDMQAAIVAALSVPNVLPAGIPIISRKTKEHGRTQDLADDLAAAVANHGLCIYVLPLLPQHAEPELPFIFFDRAEVRVRIIEQPAMNALDVDLYDLIDAVALALHAKILSDSPAQAQPLYLSETPVSLEEGVIEGGRGSGRIADVIFNAVFQLNPP
jgi:hypothetical protein